MKSKYANRIAESLRMWGMAESDAQSVASRRLPLWPKELPPATMEVRNSAGTVTIRLDGPIGIDFWTGEGITAKGIDEELKAAGKFSRIEIELNSGGGDAFEGINIHTLLSRQKVPVTVNVNGLAASAASVLAMAGDDVRMAESAMLMIHDAIVGVFGNEADHRHYADVLEKLDGQLAATYAKKSGRSADEFRPLMDAETWLTPSEAIDLGLADAVDASMRVAACAFDLKAFGYRHAPDQCGSTPSAGPAAAPAPERKVSIDDRITDHLNTLRTIPCSRTI